MLTNTSQFAWLCDLVLKASSLWRTWVDTKWSLDAFSTSGDIIVRRAFSTELECTAGLTHLVFSTQSLSACWRSYSCHVKRASPLLDVLWCGPGGVPLSWVLANLQAERTLLYTVGFRLHFDHPHFQIERLASDYRLERHYRAKAGFTLSQVSTSPPISLSSAGIVLCALFIFVNKCMRRWSSVYKSQIRVLTAFPQFIFSTLTVWCFCIIGCEICTQFVQEQMRWCHLAHFNKSSIQPERR